VGSLTGVIKAAAKRIGVSEAFYLTNLAAGLKWCCHCRQWLDRQIYFKKCISERDGLQSECASCMNTRKRSKYIPRKRMKLLPLRVATRDGDNRQANDRVDRLVQAGVIPHPRDVSCFDCGHIGPDKMHHYDHYLGYAVEHHEDVQAVCVGCHIRRGWARRRNRG
jgi:hypothetical protein